MSLGRRLAALEGQAAALVEHAPPDPGQEALVVAGLRRRAAGKRLTVRQAEAVVAWSKWLPRDRSRVMAQLTTEELEALVAWCEKRGGG